MICTAIHWVIQERDTYTDVVIGFNIRVLFTTAITSSQSVVSKTFLTSFSALPCIEWGVALNHDWAALPTPTDSSKALTIRQEPNVEHGI